VDYSAPDSDCKPIPIDVLPLKPDNLSMADS
jgi:hypothetical protein